jgi:hypothetical protein
MNVDTGSVMKRSSITCNQKHRVPCYLLYSILIGFYFFSAIQACLKKGLWSDEVLSVMIYRLENFSSINAAVWQGADYSPPTYHYIIHVYLKLFAFLPELLVYRLPSIVEIFGAAVAVFYILKRRVNFELAASSACIILCTTPFLYAIQARPYAFLLFLLSISLLIYDSLERSTRRWQLTLLLWSCLALSIWLHFYGFFYVIIIGLCEVIRYVVKREYRPYIVWMFVGLLPVALGLYPLAHQINEFLRGDIASSLNYHQTPNFYLLDLTFRDMLLGGFLGGALLILAVALNIFYFVTQILARVMQRRKKRPLFLSKELNNIEIIILALVCSLLFSFLFTLLTTKSFSPRYIFGIALFPSFMFAYLIAKVPYSRIIALLIVPILFFGVNSKANRNSDQAYESVLSFLETAEFNIQLPIVIDGDPFLALKFAASSQLRPRLNYVLTPKKDKQVNSTADRQIYRLTSVYEEMSVSVFNFDTFVQANPRFYVVSLNQEFLYDSTERALEETHLIGPVLERIAVARLRCAGTLGAKIGCEN